MATVMSNKVVTSLPGLYKPGQQYHSKSCCIYGRGGTGKTTAVGTMHGRGLVIDVPQIEGGAEVLEDKADRIDVYPVESWNQIDDVYWYLRGGKHDYKWVGIDSITAFVDLAKRRTVAERDLASDPNIIALQEWGKIGNLVDELIYRFRTLPLDVIWIAQERKHTLAENEGRAVSVMGPDVTPSILSSLVPSMTFIGRTFVNVALDGSVEYFIRLGPHPDYYTKIRARPGRPVPPVVKNPDLGVLFDYLQGGNQAPEAAEETGVLIIS